LLNRCDLVTRPNESYDHDPPIEGQQTWPSTPSAQCSSPSLPNLSFSETMGRYPSWLDANNIEPLLFRSADLTDGTVGFEIVFRTESEAQLFDGQFDPRL
jgi:hypothetical protein